MKEYIFASFVKICSVNYLILIKLNFLAYITIITIILYFTKYIIFFSFTKSKTVHKGLHQTKSVSYVLNALTNYKKNCSNLMWNIKQNTQWLISLCVINFCKPSDKSIKNSYKYFLWKEWHNYHSINQHTRLL